MIPASGLLETSWPGPLPLLQHRPPGETPRPASGSPRSDAVSGRCRTAGRHPVPSWLHWRWRSLYGQVGDVGRPHLIGPGDPGVSQPGVSQQVGIDPTLRRRPAGLGLPIDGPKPHDAHQPLHPLPAYLFPPPLQPGLHPPGSVERGLQVLPVDLTHQGQVLFGDRLGTVVEAGTAHPQQGALPATSGVPGPPSPAAGPDSWTGPLRQEIPLHLNPNPPNDGVWEVC